MAMPVNDRDVLLVGSSQRNANPLDADIILTLDNTNFHTDSSGNNALPSQIVVTAHLISLVGTVHFTASNATVTDNGDNTATLQYTSVTTFPCTITASITVNGESFSRSISINRLQDGASGAGVAGNQYAPVSLYQWSTAVPAKPTGTSGFTWATQVNSTYGASDGWSVAIPPNPGGPGVRLYTATVQIAATGGTTSTIVSYTNATIAAITANGATGADGKSGFQTAEAKVYQWATSIPAGPSGTANWVWATRSFGNAPTGWTLTPGIAPSQGITLWAATVYLVDSATVVQTRFDWTNANVHVESASGSNGLAGASGASSYTAYCASTTPTTNTAPAQTTGKTSVPATNDGGITGTWSRTVPVLAVGQFQYQSNGTYDPSTDKITWSVPYQSALKVGSLSAITANLGSINAGNIDLGTGALSWHVDPNGNQWMGASTFAAAPLSFTNTGVIKAMTGLFAGTLGAGIVTASSIVVGGSPDNILPDPRFKDLPWWGMAGFNGYINDFSATATATGWTSGSSAQFSTGPYMEFLSSYFAVTPGATYKLDIQAYLASDFAGQFSVYLYFPGSNTFHGLGQPNLYDWGQNNYPNVNVQYDGSTTAKSTLLAYTATYTVPATAGNERARFIIFRKVDAGTIQIGGMAMTRVADSVLIQDGAVTATKISVQQLSAISANIGTLTNRVNGTGAGFERAGATDKVYDGNNVKRVQIGDLNA